LNENAPVPGAAIAAASLLADFQPLNAAEAKVLAELKSGDFERLGDGLRPEWDDPARIVRAEFIRFLILGGDEGSRLHEKGLRLSGARVTGKLDLEGCRIPRDIGLKDCRFDASPVLRSAIIDSFPPCFGKWAMTRMPSRFLSPRNGCNGAQGGRGRKIRRFDLCWRLSMACSP
jgi:hypothetical protein